MRPLLLLLLAALTASAADPDIDSPGFWSKTYAIPPTYCQRSIAVSSPRVEALMKAAAPCGFIRHAGGARSDCRLPREESDRVVAELRRLGEMTAFSQDCGAPPDRPELYYKREHLSREWEETALSSATAPGINGLLSAQLATLDELLAAHEAALETALTISISGPAAMKRPPGAAAAPAAAPSRKNAARRRGLPASAQAADSWVRRSRSVCEQIPQVIIGYEKLEDPEGDPRLRTARRLGKPYVEPACRSLDVPGLAAAIFSARPEQEIRRALARQPGLRLWRVQSAGAIVADDARFDALSAELASQRAALERAPHIRALIRAEIDRVRENAEKLHALRAGRLLLITITR